MATILLRLAGPMQSWGLKSEFELRNSLMTPTKSGVVGLICAALGRDRSKPIDDLTSLKMGVRVDQQGKLVYDYQTALCVAKADDSTPDTQTSLRYYLEEASFLVGLEGDSALLEKISDALKNPVWPIFLGRKSYIPTQPIVISNPIKSVSLIAALENEPLPSGKSSVSHCRLILECDISEAECLVSDVPISFDYDKRAFVSRPVKTLWRESKNIGESNVL